MYRYYECDLSYCSYIKLSEDGTAVPKHVAEIEDCNVVNVTRAVVGLVKENQHPSFRCRKAAGLMTRGAVMSERSCTFIGYQVCIKLVGICSYRAVMLTPVLAIQ
jgi:hypothetical protein